MARKGAPDSEVRAQLVEAAHQIIQEQGAHAVTARCLADRVGLKRQIVHYYFGTLDDLFVAVLERQGDESRERFQNALASQSPLRVTWEQAHDASASLFEFIALAMHRPSIREVLARYMDEFRAMQASALKTYLAERGVDPEISPMVITVMLASISQALALERALGVDMGHEDTTSTITHWLKLLEVENP